MKRALLLIVLLTAALLLYGIARRSAPPSEIERNRAFTESMSGVTLVGNSTRLNRDGVSGPEHYYIDGVNHIAGDAWLFRTRLSYHGKDIPVPIPISVKWAGDTPVITLTDLSIPGFGTYSARVVLYRGQYAGTWSGQKGGGQLFGKIVRGTAP
jgi:hypothetical protein